MGQLGDGFAATSTSATATAAPASLGRGTGDLSTGRSHRPHQARKARQGEQGVPTGQGDDMAQAAATGAGPTEELVDVLALALAGQLDQAQFRDLGNLWPGFVIPHGRDKVLQQQKLIPARLHVDEIDDDHTTDVAQLELPGNLRGRLTVGPENRLAGVGRPGEGAGVDVNHREGLGGLDDHVAARRQINPGLEGITDGRVDLEVLQQVGRLVVVLDDQAALVRPQEGEHPGAGLLGVHHDPDDLGVVEIPQHPVNEVFVAVQQHRRLGRLGGLLDRLPLAQQPFEIVDDLLFRHPFGLGAHQQGGARGLDQHGKGPQAVALGLPADPPRDVHPLPMGLKNQVATGQGEIARETGTLGAGGLLHHLNQHLLAGLKQLCDSGASLAQPQGAQIGDMDETIFLALSDIDEGSINAGQDIFNSTEIDITDLMAPLGNDELVNPFVAEHCGDAQLLSDHNLLWHGLRQPLTGSPEMEWRLESQVPTGSDGRRLGCREAQKLINQARRCRQDHKDPQAERRCPGETSCSQKQSGSV